MQLLGAGTSRGRGWNPLRLLLVNVRAFQVRNRHAQEHCTGIFVFLRRSLLYEQLAATVSDQPTYLNSCLRKLFRAKREACIGSGKLKEEVLPYGISRDIRVQRLLQPSHEQQEISRIWDKGAFCLAELLVG
jgi:hypothetical protein